jgi:hypothetical protein
MVIRHGEKPSDKDSHVLSPKAEERAKALPAIFTAPRADLYKPSWIFASKGQSASLRMVQTATPTANALGLTLNTQYDVENAIALTATLLVKQAKAGLKVLAVVEHSAIPALLAEIAKLLGTKVKTPTTHGDSDFYTGYLFEGTGFRTFQESVLSTDPGYKAPPATDPAPTAEYPAQVLDLKNWKLTLPIEAVDANGKGLGKPQEVKQPALATYKHADWFKVEQGGVRFRAAVNGFTTSGSQNPRSELREMNPDGSNASWSSTSGTHTLVVEEAVLHMPNARTDGGNAAVVTAQIHDANDDISVFRVEGSKVYVTNGDDTHYKLVTDKYVPGTKFEAKYVVSGGKVQAYYNGQLVATIAKSFSGAYFKAGAYTQANCGNSSPCSVDNYGETRIYKVQVTHK